VLDLPWLIAARARHAEEHRWLLARAELVMEHLCNSTSTRSSRHPISRIQEILRHSQ